MPSLWYCRARGAFSLPDWPSRGMDCGQRAGHSPGHRELHLDLVGHQDPQHRAVNALLQAVPGRDGGECGLRAEPAPPASPRAPRQLRANGQWLEESGQSPGQGPAVLPARCLDSALGGAPRRLLLSPHTPLPRKRGPQLPAPTARDHARLWLAPKPTLGLFSPNSLPEPWGCHSGQPGSWPSLPLPSTPSMKHPQITEGQAERPEGGAGGEDCVARGAHQLPEDSPPLSCLCPPT